MVTTSHQKTIIYLQEKNVDSIDILHRFVKDFEVFELNFDKWFDAECRIE